MKGSGIFCEGATIFNPEVQEKVLLMGKAVFYTRMNMA
jgi:hypothetical protein